ncbi:hypothetical protein CGC56_10185 [Capnocytophaga canimorsus]|uniref:Uncharacterized protein n=1 Tax=Capnocytophaga canimorsus TaxID=28188 RepID=A0A250G6V8_9FLAO|nr:hypothetical protein [Capnocytophaga canimorsus]ATA92495.1 hypothetical protein CGC56_10185 [Capnocytophaga canimorsus]
MLCYKIIGEDYFSKIDEKTFNQIVTDFGYSKELVFNSNKYSKYLHNYIILTSFPCKEFDIESKYISRYYWLKKFYYEYSKIEGLDAGIEQQIAMLLEEMANNVSENFNWNIIEEIYKQFEI